MADISLDGGASNAGDIIGGVKELWDKAIDTFTPAGLPGDDTLDQSNYDFTERYFPSNLLADGSFNNHWILFNINVKDNSNFASYFNPEGDFITEYTRTDELSKVDALRTNIDQRWRGAVNNRFGVPQPGEQFSGPNWIFVPRRTRRIVESIALFMPSTVQFSQRNDYEDISLTKFAADTVGGMASLLGGKKAGALVGSAYGAASTITGLAQNPINPRMEVLFSKTPLREFQFDFLFAPTSQQETDNLRKILRDFRFHAAPEVTSVDGGFVEDFIKGLLWIPPSEFDITFYHGAKENLEIPRINTCAITAIDIDYAPSGVYSTFSNGAPVRTRMMLRFRELEVLHKLRVAQGF